MEEWWEGQVLWQEAGGRNPRDVKTRLKGDAIIMNGIDV